MLAIYISLGLAFSFGFALLMGRLLRRETDLMSRLAFMEPGVWHSLFDIAIQTGLPFPELVFGLEKLVQAGAMCRVFRVARNDEYIDYAHFAEIPDGTLPGEIRGYYKKVEVEATSPQTPC